MKQADRPPNRAVAHHKAPLERQPTKTPADESSWLRAVGVVGSLLALGVAIMAYMITDEGPPPSVAFAPQRDMGGIPSLLLSQEDRELLRGAGADTLLASATVGILAGVVYNLEDRQPIPTAQVTMGRYGALTDQLGRFLLVELEPGAYEVRVSHPDFAPIRANLRIESEEVTVGTVGLRPN